MTEQFDEASLNEKAINDVETGRLALRWALDKIRALQEDALRGKQTVQEKSSQVAFLEGQLKNKNSEIEKILRSHDEELKSEQNSLEFQFRSKLERLSEREKELEDKASRHEEDLKLKESRVVEEYQKKSDELRARWAQVEAELWQVRQEQLLKQQEFEKIYSGRLDEERKKSASGMEDLKAGLEKVYGDKLAALEKREAASGEEFKKQEAVLKWAKDSFQQEAAEREKALKQKEFALEAKLTEKSQEIEDYKVKIGLLQKQLAELPEAVRRRDEDLNRYKQAMESLEGVIRALESEKKSLQADSEHKLLRLNESLEAEKNRYNELEIEIPKRLKIAIEHERGRLAEKLSEMENGYREDLRKRQEEIDFLERNMKSLEENGRVVQADRDALARKAEQLQTQYNVKQEEFLFREKQLQSEYEVRLGVELDKHSSALKSEIESARRIYEDNLRLKVEEIAHLRRELEGAVNDSMAYQTQTAESRRAVDAVKVKADADITALRAQLKAAYERQLSEELAEAGSRHAAEKQNLVAAFEGQLKDAGFGLSRKEEEVQRLRAELSGLKEECKLMVAEERRRGKAESQAQRESFAETAGLYDEKLSQLNRTLEAGKIEREESLLLERERLERLYAEKEKDLDERFYRKDQEVARLREETVALRGERERVLAELDREKGLESARVRALNEKLTARETEFQRELEEMLAKKNKELESVRLAEEAREEAYRRSLEDFRSKLSDAMVRIEAMKKDEG
jgi:chromosome segregation ATPase